MEILFQKLEYFKTSVSTQLSTDVKKNHILLGFKLFKKKVT